MTSHLATTGAVAGLFLHRTSRALDPHLHTHAVVANVALGVDGAWSAADGRRLFRHLRAVQGVYHARLRRELGERLGVAWQVRPSGLGDVVGIDPALPRLFSQRSAGVDEHLRAHGGRRERGRAASVAALVTRPDKDRTVTVEELHEAWRDRARDFGFDLGELSKVVGLGRTAAPPATVDADRLLAQLGTAPGERQLARRDVVAAVAASSLRGAHASELEAVAASLTDSSDSARCARSAATVSTGHEPRWRAADLTGRLAAGAPLGDLTGRLAAAAAGDLVLPRGRVPAGRSVTGREVGRDAGDRAFGQRPDRGDALAVR